MGKRDTRSEAVGSLAVVALAALAVMGCGGSSSSSSAAAGSSSGAGVDGAVAPSGNYLPLTVGMSWTYNITAASGATGQGATTVEATENAPMAGQSALRVHSVWLDGGTLAWEQVSGSAAVRIEEQELDQSGAVIVDKQYMPPILVLDQSEAHLTSGATWTENYMELKTPSTKKKATKETTEWTVESVNDSVTVPAGTYNCIRVRRNHTSSKTPSNSVSWYAIGVGKVRETGAGQHDDQTLELASVKMP
jgi:hypothetical protein